MKTIEIYDLAKKNNIDIIQTSLPQTSCVSLKYGKDQYCIGIDPDQITSSADERVKIAHDLGHCMTDSFYNKYSPLDLRSKHECRATTWSIKELIPFDELMTAMKQGCSYTWQIAEYFDVTEELVHKALEYYESDLIEERKQEGFIT